MAILTPANLLLQLKQTNTSGTNGSSGTGNGLGFKRSTPVPLTDLKTSAGLTLTGATSPLVAALETNAIGVQWASSNSSKAAYIIHIPGDYDETTDTLLLNYLVNSAGTTDSPTLTANVYQKRAGTALSADLAPAATTAIPKTTAATAAAYRTITVSGKGLKGGDVLTVLVAPGAHTTDAVNLYSFNYTYYSTLVPFDPTLR